MRENVLIDARHVPASALELLQEFKAYVDGDLQQHYSYKGVRLFNEHFCSGDAEGLTVGLQFHLGQDGFRVEGDAVAHVPHCFKHLPVRAQDAGDAHMKNYRSSEAMRPSPLVRDCVGTV